MIEAYTAGFLDADGSVALTKTGGGPNWQRSPLVSFYNCDKNMLEAVQKNYGGKIKANKPTSIRHNVSYHLQVERDNAIVLLNDVLPFMRHTKKKRRGELIVEHYKNFTPRNGKYTEVEPKSGNSFI